MIVYDHVKKLEELKKLLKKSGLSVADCQIVHTTGRCGGDWYVFYDDGTASPDVPAQNAGTTVTADDNTIDLSDDEEVVFTRRGRTIKGFTHEFGKKTKTKGAVSSYIDDCTMSVSVATDYKTAHLEETRFGTGNIPQAVVTFTNKKNFEITGSVTFPNFHTADSENAAMICVDGYDQIKMLADALETAAVRLRMLMKG